MDAAERLATYSDLLKLPEEQRGEVVAGNLNLLPAPLPRHSRVQRSLAGAVGKPFDDDDGYGGPGGWWILLEVDIQLSVHDVVRPDIAGWKRERLQSPWDQRPITTRPDWLCEVLSPSNVAHDRVHKRRLYAEHGVAYYWIADPAARTLEALQLVSGQWLDVGTYDARGRVAVPPFQSVELDLARIFPPE